MAAFTALYIMCTLTTLTTFLHTPSPLVHTPEPNQVQSLWNYRDGIQLADGRCAAAPWVRSTLVDPHHNDAVQRFDCQMIGQDSTTLTRRCKSNSTHMVPSLVAFARSSTYAMDASRTTRVHTESYAATLLVLFIK
ncbi:hypothetical protein H257_10136 [Aphanomyces astaci]|uniref:Secreted protein n=1 Tax=Aphanomyces astaci TaxID=112090 RepID=W4G7X0_APHAT|nr:hypothetical protein H257_10136 [Aphanomyces astaci]ETV75765.1 hypothetical protein H257_10136 [Aphanomyces astaci]|eukprot:XP_009834896.1 hypothetical protein H257_10136 [Aphanomyces astaci]